MKLKEIKNNLLYIIIKHIKQNYLSKYRTLFIIFDLLKLITFIFINIIIINYYIRLHIYKDKLKNN
jgi:hypothetical protein